MTPVPFEPSPKSQKYVNVSPAFGSLELPAFTAAFLFLTTDVGDVNKLPASQRFFAGGDNSVRGYQFESLGPTDESGEVIGGKHLVVGSIELDHRITDSWNAAVFYDIGNAINSVNDELFAGAGVGVRWKSPVGPVRFDFAWALDKTDEQFRLHVVIGPDL